LGIVRWLFLRRGGTLRGPKSKLIVFACAQHVKMQELAQRFLGRDPEGDTHGLRPKERHRGMVAENYSGEKSTAANWASATEN
jgi:hypothetical protein